MNATRAAGTIVARNWEIVGFIGSGGIAEVYEVQNTKTRRLRSALKLLREELVHRPDYAEIRRRFDHEPDRQSALHHPNIVRVDDVGDDPVVGLYIRMELIIGDSLENIRKRSGALPYDQVLRFGGQIAAALDCAHSAGIIHRDIKGSNILVRESTQQPMVTDFGIAKQMSNAGDLSMANATQGVIGTLRYMAPEQFRSEDDLDHRADIYALGCVLYEMYSGERFADSLDDIRVASLAAFQEGWQAPLAYPVAPPRELAELIRSCLQQRREDRPTSAAEVMAILRHLEEQARIVGKPVEPVPAPVSLEAIHGNSPQAEPVARPHPEPGPVDPGVDLSRTCQARNDEVRTRIEEVEVLAAEAREWGMADAAAPRHDLRIRWLDVGTRLTAAEKANDGDTLRDCCAAFEELQCSADSVRKELSESLQGLARQRVDGLRQLCDSYAVVAQECGMAPERFDRAIEPVELLVEAGRWLAARTALDVARREIQRDVQRIAGDLLMRADVPAQIVARATRQRPSSVLDRAAEQAVIRSQIESGAWSEAIEHAATLRIRTRSQLERLLSDQTEQLLAVEGLTTTLRDQLDRDLAMRVAPALLDDADKSTRQALAAQQSGDVTAAIDHYERAAAGYGAVAQTVGYTDPGPESHAVHPSRWPVAGVIAIGTAIAILAVAAYINRQYAWIFGGENVVRDVAEWQDESSVATVGAQTFAATAGPGRSDDQVAHVDAPAHAPRIVSLSPSPDHILARRIGDEIAFVAEATDADGDSLTYVWTVDGKAMSRTPNLRLEVRDNHSVQLSVSDGTATVESQWRIELKKASFQAEPRTLGDLRFRDQRELALVPDSIDATRDVTYAWVLDGERVSSQQTFLLRADREEWVRPRPLPLTVTASGPTGVLFRHAWKLRVLPPDPRIQGGTPEDGQVIRVDPGSSTRFTVVADKPVGDQRLEYVFEVDGSEVARGSEASFTYDGIDDAEHVLIAYVEDNFGLKSTKQLRWHVRADSLVARVEAWVAELQAARVAHDASREAKLRKLGAQQEAKLHDSYRGKSNLTFSFLPAQIEAAGPQTARATLTFDESFEAPDGTVVRNKLSCRFTLVLAGGALMEAPDSEATCRRIE